MSKTERSFIMVKPDGVKRGLVGEVVSRFERRGFKLVAASLITPTKDTVERHYAEHVDKPFFKGLLSFITSGKVFISVWEGPNVVSIARVMIGTTNPATALPGTVRGDYATIIDENIIHASDSVESAEREIPIWFGDNVHYDL